MPRDSNGNYTLPAGNPVTANTVIEADGWGNPTMEDLAAAMTDSLSREGQGGMLAPFLNQDGTMANPGMTWTNEPSSGWYRKAPGEFWYSVSGADIFGISGLGIELAPGAGAEGISSFIQISDTQPPLVEGEQWFKSDGGQFVMEYVNPDASTTLIATVSAGGDFVPYGEKDQPNGVPSLDANSHVPAMQLLNAFPIGAIYMTADNNSPQNWMGGVWSQVAQGRVLLGVGTLGSDTYVAGDTGGLATVSLTDAQNGIHNHSVSDPGHTHSPIGGGNLVKDSVGQNNATGPGPLNYFVQSPSLTTEGTGIAVNNSSGGAAHENRQPYLAIYYWQRTA